ncbi:MAG: hypothetical protein IPO85_10715 [Saprospiraceae bacterium]|uniref:Uncharacterized protein n=1 Tax=Candidatus Defluviibacterium haderslevense TaxID=2981993 RepID=A0A9D7S9Z8_9BACT|nr:hypothetical protein [Candidatus Defluviibacterium haderslevense]
MKNKISKIGTFKNAKSIYSILQVHLFKPENILKIANLVATEAHANKLQ